jgi:hypothetical protein
MYLCWLLGLRSTRSIKIWRHNRRTTACIYYFMHIYLDRYIERERVQGWVLQILRVHTGVRFDFASKKEMKISRKKMNLVQSKNLFI